MIFLSGKADLAQVSGTIWFQKDSRWSCLPKQHGMFLGIFTNQEP